MTYHIIPDAEALSKCTWCGKHISEDAEVFSVGVKFKPDVDLSEYEGHCIDITLVSEEKPFYLLVTIEGSEAKRDGNDGLFLFCSEACGDDLKRALAKEMSAGKLFEAFDLD